MEYGLCDCVLVRWVPSPRWTRLGPTSTYILPCSFLRSDPWRQQHNHKSSAAAATSLLRRRYGGRFSSSAAATVAAQSDSSQRRRSTTSPAATLPPPSRDASTTMTTVRVLELKSGHCNEKWHYFSDPALSTVKPWPSK